MNGRHAAEGTFLIYVRQSYHRAIDADVSPEAQRRWPDELARLAVAAQLAVPDPKEEDEA